MAGCAGGVSGIISIGLGAGFAAIFFLGLAFFAVRLAFFFAPFFALRFFGKRSHRPYCRSQFGNKACMNFAWLITESRLCAGPGSECILFLAQNLGMLTSKGTKKFEQIE
jgi:hypothetical protein